MEVGGDAVEKDGAVGGGESMMLLSSSSESDGLVIWGGEGMNVGFVIRLFCGRFVVGVIVNCGSVGDVEVARMQCPVGVVPQSVCSFVVVSWQACFAEASVGVVDVGEVAWVPVAVRKPPQSVRSAVVLGHRWGSGGGTDALDFIVTNRDGRWNRG